MRVCFIATSGIHTRRWVRYFVERGHEVHLISIHPVQPAWFPGAEVYDLTAQTDIRKVRFLIWAHAVRQIVRDIRPDILHAHYIAGPGWLGAAAGYHPLIVSAWGSDLLVGPTRSWIQSQLARWTLRRADYVTCVSQSLARAALALGADPDLLEVAPWGVDTDLFHPAPDRGALRSRLGLGSGQVVLSVRAMQAGYNPLDIAQAIPRVLGEIPSTRFVIRTYHADPDLLAQFQAIVDENRVTEAVQYVADLPDERSIAELYQVADVAISVPPSDGAPASVLEALACGAVPVLSDISSLREWVQHEQEGLFVPVGNVPALSAAIVRLLADDSLRSDLRLSGARLVRERADTKVWMRRNEEISRRLASGEN